ncbi:MAG: hypothetical protein M2R45_04287 [Verrucomicrobia subdivision 3 bacterium]|nr:hypothetical protein [Limisphaerales bacterium]MCS1417394.1 hypothetical protein [Limisphaerales bacterium]
MAKKRQVFYSFHYKPDNWRASQVRNIGSVEGNRPATDNDWETVKKGGDSAIKKWIDDQMKHRSCTVVLVGEHTADRKWINYEIIKSWNDGMDVVGIHIHGLKDRYGYISKKGSNPFDYVSFTSGKKLSSIVKCYDPPGTSSKDKYDRISKHLSNVIEEAIKIRRQAG